jgi:hypothetical protein
MLLNGNNTKSCKLYIKMWFFIVRIYYLYLMSFIIIIRICHHFVMKIVHLENTKLTKVVQCLMMIAISMSTVLPAIAVNCHN